MNSFFYKLKYCILKYFLIIFQYIHTDPKIKHKHVIGAYKLQNVLFVKAKKYHFKSCNIMNY